MEGQSSHIAFVYLDACHLLPQQPLTFLPGVHTEITSKFQDKCCHKKSRTCAKMLSQAITPYVWGPRA